MAAADRRPGNYGSTASNTGFGFNYFPYSPHRGHKWYLMGARAKNPLRSEIADQARACMQRKAAQTSGG